jgi:hypothetical protein
MLKKAVFNEGEDKQIDPSGFINAYMHFGSPKFIQVGDEPNQGYLEFPEGTVIREMHVKNLIVSKASTFMAKRMRPGTSWGAGISHLEVGTGVGTGTTQAPQVESVSQTALRTPLARKAITSWTYLDTAGAATAAETNVVQITTTFLETEAIGAIVEMGLFGGDSTTTLSSGYMFNYKVFPVWNKQSGMQLTVIWKLTF